VLLLLLLLLLLLSWHMLHDGPVADAAADNDFLLAYVPVGYVVVTIVDVCCSCDRLLMLLMPLAC
jgi:hypothetical protein